MIAKNANGNRALNLCESYVGRGNSPSIFLFLKFYFFSVITSYRLPVRVWRYIAPVGTVIIGGGKRWLEKGIAKYRRDPAFWNVPLTTVLFGFTHYWPGWVNQFFLASKTHLPSNEYASIVIAVLVIAIFVTPPMLNLAANILFYKQEFSRLRQAWATNMAAG